MNSKDAQNIQALVNIAQCTSKDVNYLENKLIEFNSKKVPFTQEQNFIDINYVLKDESGNIIGGITSTLYCWKILYINILYVDEKYRSKGYGSNLVK